MNLILSLLINSFAIFIVAHFLEGVAVDGFLTAMIVAVLLGVVNTFIKPILVLLTLPLNIITLGLFTFVINGLLILLIDALIQGFTVNNFLWAVVFSILISLISSILGKLFNN